VFSRRAVVSTQVAIKVIITCVLGISTTFFIIYQSRMIISHGKNTNLSLFGKMIYSLLNVLRLLVFNGAISVYIEQGKTEK